MTGPAHPGPRPDELTFDFVAAEEARAQAERLAERLALLRDQHLQHVEGARRDFAGETRQEFDRRFERLVGELELLVSDLRGQARELGEEIDRARLAQQQRQEAIAEWEHAWARYQEARQRPEGVR